jgi:predicted nucleotidyltransferase
VRSAAGTAAAALRAHYGASVAVYLFGSVLDPDQFRLDSDLDLAVRGVPSDRYYEAWRLAEAAAGVGQLDLIRLEDASEWLAAEVQAHGERLA